MSGLDEKKALEQANQELQNEIERRKRAEEKLKSRKVDLQLILDSVPTMIFSKDLKGRHILINRKFWETLERPEGELIGKSSRDLFPDYADIYDADDAEVIATGQPLTELVRPFPTPKGLRRVRMNKLPLRDSQGTIIGLLGFYNDITKDKEYEEKLEADREKINRMASELSRTEERERRKIAMELHDHIGPTLALAKMQLVDVMGTTPYGERKSSLDSILKLVESIIADTRSLTVQLSPPILYEFGFESAVEWLLDQMKEQHGLEYEFYDDLSAKPLEENVRMFLYRGVRELLINVVKHARARLVRASVRREGDEIAVEILDDGAGFLAERRRERPNPTDGFGLFSIQDRMEYIGGSFAIHSATGRGTRAILRAPLCVQKPTSET